MVLGIETKKYFTNIVEGPDDFKTSHLLKSEGHLFQESESGRLFLQESFVIYVS